MSMINIISQIIIPSVMVAVTGITAHFTYSSVKELKKTRKEANTAEVAVYFKVEYGRIYLIVENIGKTIAKNVKIKSEPLLKDSSGEIDTNFKDISFLPPNYPMKTFFDLTYGYKEEYQKCPKTTFSVSFENIYNETIERKYVSDLSYLENKGNYALSESQTIERSLYNMNKHLKEIIKNTEN